MAFVLQDDTGLVAGANGYIDEAFFNDYHTDRGNTIPTGTQTADINAGIIQATDYIDMRFCFVGIILNEGQSTAWPRKFAYDTDGYLITGIPQALKEACAEYALRAISATLMADPETDATGQTVKERKQKVGSLEEHVVFQDGATYSLPQYPMADNILFSRGLVDFGNKLRRA